MIQHLEKLNLAGIGMIAMAVVWMFTTFVHAEDHEKEHNDLDALIALGQYYDRLDDFDEAEDEENFELATEYAIQMEELKIVICAHKPHWDRCDDDDV